MDAFEASALLRSELFVTEYVLESRERQMIGLPAGVWVRALLDTPVQLGDLVGSRAELVLRGIHGETRRTSALIESAEVCARTVADGDELPLYEYIFELVSEIGILGRDIDSWIYQDLSAQEIITKVLDDHGITGSRVVWKLSASYEKLEYCTRYEESALHFIARLAETEGFYFYSETDADSGEEKLIFADASDQAESERTLPLRHPTQMAAEQAAVYQRHERRAVQTGKITLNALDFKRPALDLKSSATADEWTDLERYDYSDDYVEPSVGKRLAQVRLEALQAERVRVRILADDLLLHVGQILTIEAPDAEIEYFVVEIQHQYRRHGGGPTRGASQGDQYGRSYEVEAELIPRAVPYRLPVRHARPVIYGPQTATVVAPEGAQMEEIYCDEHGRCKVKFHWDRGSENFDKASCWMRVTQLQTSGSMVLPRVHWEVLVEFLEGNPDKPYISGRLFNGTFMPPYALPEGKTRTSLKTASTPGGGGTNEIRFEDRAGAEEIMINAQYNMVIAAANNRDKKVTGNETLIIDNNASTEVGADSEVKVTNGYKHTVGADQTISVGANRTVEVNAVYGLTTGGNATTTVGANEMRMVGNPLDGIISLAAAAAAEAAAGAAAQVAARVQGAVDGAVGAALGPIQGVVNQANSLAAPMNAMSGGRLAPVAGLLGQASSLPTPSGLAAGLMPAGARAAPGSEESAGEISFSNMVQGAASNLAGRGLAQAQAALLGGGGADASGAGGRSMTNSVGPAGELAGFTEEDVTAGAGHDQYVIQGSHTENIGALGVTAAVGTVLTNVTANMTQTVGAAHVEVVLGNRAESAEGMKTENSLGLVVIAKGNESESVQGIRSTMIGGARVEQVDGNREVSSDAMISMVGAMHKVEAKTKLTFSCGASSIVVDGSGITFQSPMVDVMAASITLKKDVSDG